MRAFRSAARTSALLAALACRETGPTEPPPVLQSLPRTLTDGERRAIEAANGFAFALLKRIDQRGADSTQFVSPLSISMALGMALQGARGSTLDAMRATLGFGSMTGEEIGASYRGLIDLLRGLDRQVEFELANSMWVNQNFAVDPAFAEVARRYFAAETGDLDFTAPSSVTTINTWVSDKTRGRITSILESIDPQEVLFLLNAIYFKGTWREGFDPAQTSDASFSGSGAPQSIRLMHRKGMMPYHDAEGFEAVDLSYGAAAYSMTVLLPKEGRTVNDLVQSLTPEVWSAMTTGFHQAEVDLFLPAFRLEYQRSLKDDLSSLGISAAFDPREADFAGIGADLFLTRVEHKTYVEVDEAGTTAAAVTGVGVGVVSLPRQVTFRVDRSFMFALRERFSGTILFLGKVTRLPD